MRWRAGMKVILIRIGDKLKGRYGKKSTGEM
jgi:hypothetical protein